MIGRKLGDRYEILTELGRGGMGIVYRARDPFLGREVAIKFIPPTLMSDAALARFEREARVVAGLDHPGIVAVYDIGHHEGSLFFVMPVVKGESLRALLVRRRQLAIGHALEISAQVAEALDYSHRHGIVHRDVKPENVMVETDANGAPRVRVMDFGLARGESQTEVTRTGAIVGTISYLSPEQIQARTPDQRSDVYSLGVVLFECLTGDVPFPGEMYQKLRAILDEPAPAPRTLVPELDPTLDALVLRCLAKEPGSRPASAGEVALQLRTALGQVPIGEASIIQALPRDSGRSGSGTSAAPSKIVGRQTQLSAIGRHLERGRGGKPQLVVIEGGAGIGKRALLDAAIDVARSLDFQVVRARMRSRDPIGALESALEASNASRVDLGSDSAVVSRSGSSSGIVNLTSGEFAFPASHEALERVGERVTQRLDAGEVLLLALDELPLNEAGAQLVSACLDHAQGRTMVVLASCSPRERGAADPLGAAGHELGERSFARFVLEPLSRDEVGQLLSRLESGTVTEHLVDQVYDATAGVPGLVIELAHTLRDAGHLVRHHSGEVSLSSELSADVLPPALLESAQRDLERLGADDRALIAAASILKGSFDERDLAALVDEDADIEDAIDRLVDARVLEEDANAKGDRVRFRSGVVRMVAHAELSRRKRRGLHRKVATDLERRHGNRLERVRLELVRHWGAAREPVKAVEHALEHARGALAAADTAEAERVLQMALRLIDDEWDGDPCLPAEVRRLRARARRGLGEHDRSLADLAEAYKIFDQAGDEQRALDCIMEAAETGWTTRRLAVAEQWVERGLERTAGTTSDARLRLLPIAVSLLSLRGDQERARLFSDELMRLREGEVKVRELPRGGTLSIVASTRIGSIDPVALTTDLGFEMSALVFETLLRAGGDGVPTSGLARSCRRREGGRVFELELDTERRFSDQTRLDAHQIKLTMEAAVRRCGARLPEGFAAIEGVGEFVAALTDDIAGIVATSEHTLEMHLVEPLAIFPAYLTDARTAIALPRGSGLIGSGAFVVEGDVGRTARMVRNPAHGEGKPLIDEVRVSSDQTSTDVAMAIRSGKADVARDLGAEIEDLLRDPRFRTGAIEQARAATAFALLNTRRTGSPTSDPVTRRCILGALRPEETVWRHCGRNARPAAQLLPPGVFGHDANAVPFAYERPDGRPYRLRAVAHPHLLGPFAALVDALLADWAANGIEVVVEPLGDDWTEEASSRASEIDLVLGIWRCEVADPDNFTHALFHSQGGALRKFYHWSEMDRMLDAARFEVEPRRRAELYGEIEAKLAQHGVLLPLFHEIDVRVISRRVVNLKMLSVPPFVLYDQVAIDDDARQSGLLARSGRIHVPMSGTLTSLDPARVETNEAAEVVPCVFEPLTRRIEGARVEPWLADQLEPEDGGRRWHIRLRRGVRFSDGRSLTSRDVRFTFERIVRDEKCDFRWLLELIEGARELIDGQATRMSGLRLKSDTQIELRLVERIPFFPAMLSFPGLGIVQEAAARATNSGDMLVGSGPFRVGSFTSGSRVDLERNPFHWRDGIPRSNHLRFTFQVPPSDIMASFRSGQFSLATDLAPADLEALLDDPELSQGARETPRLSSFFLVFRVAGSDRIGQVELRRQIGRSIDVDNLVRTHLGRLAIPATTLLPPGLASVESDSSMSSGSFASWSSASAGEATVGGSVELRLAVHPVFLDLYEPFVEALAERVRAIGHRLEIVSRNAEEYYACLDAGSFDLLLTRWIADYPDADGFLYGLLHSSNGYMAPVCGSAAIDEMLESARVERDPVSRQAIYGRLEEWLAMEAIVVPLFHDQTFRVGRPEVTGLKLSLMSPIVAYEHLEVVSDRLR